MAKAQSSGRATPKIPQKESPTGSPRRLTDTPFKTTEDPLHREVVQPSIKLPQEMQGKPVGGSAKPTMSVPVKLDQALPEQSSSTWSPPERQRPPRSSAIKSTDNSPKFSRPEAKLGEETSPKAKGSRRAFPASGKVVTPPESDGSPIQRRSVQKPGGSPALNVSPKSDSSPKGGASPSLGSPRSKLRETSRRIPGAGAEAGGSAPAQAGQGGNDKKGQPSGTTTPASIKSPGKSPARGHGKPEWTGQSGKGSRRGSRSAKGRAPTEGEFSSALIQYGAQSKMRSSPQNQTGPALYPLSLIIFVCTGTILLSIAVLVITLYMMKNFSKPASNSTLAPRA